MDRIWLEVPAIMNGRTPEAALGGREAFEGVMAGMDDVGVAAPQRAPHDREQF